MSHVVQIQTEVRDPTAVTAACKRLSLPAPVHGTHRLFSESIEGLAVALPNWRYPVVCNTESGQLRYDNYSGRWGEQVQLDRFVQQYAVAKATLEARKRGHTVTEQPLADGSIKLSVQLGESA